MTLRFVDGWDHYSTAQIARKWTSAGGQGTVTSGGRNGSRYQTNDYSTNNNQLKKTLDAQATWVLGFAFQTGGLVAGAVIAALVDAATTQVDLRINSDGTLSVTRNGTNLASTVASLSLSTWYYLELKVTIHPTAGAYELRINGVNRASASGVNTRATANSTANIVQVGHASAVGAGGNGKASFDDFYACDGAGGSNNDFLGDCRVEVLFPSGAGNTTQWTASTGSNYQCVDEAPANDDTDYVSSGTAGQKDTYQFGNLAGTPSAIYGVQICTLMRKDDAGTRTIAPVTRSGSTDYDGANASVLDSYSYDLQIRETNPAGGPWSAAAVNAAEFGVKLIA